MLLITFVVMLGFGIVAPTLPLYARSFGVPYAAVGLLLSGFGAVRLISQPAGGALVDRWGDRKVAVLGIGILVLSSTFSGLAQNFAWLLVARSIGGIGSAWFITSLYAHVLGMVDKAQAGRFLSTYQASFTAGITMGPVAGGLVAQYFGLRAPFLFYAGFCTISGVIAFRKMTKTPGARLGKVQGSGFLSWRLLPRRKLYLFAIGANFAFWWTMTGARTTLIPLFATDVLGASTGWIGLAVTVSAIASFIVLPHAGRVSDKGRLRVLVPSVLLTAGLTALLGLVGTKTAFLVLFAVLGLAQGYARVPALALVADVIEERNRGRAVAVHQMAGDLGAILGPFTAGALASLVGFGQAFALIAIPAAIVAFVALGTHPPLPRKVGGLWRPDPEQV